MAGYLFPSTAACWATCAAISAGARVWCAAFLATSCCCWGASEDSQTAGWPSEVWAATGSAAVTSTAGDSSVLMTSKCWTRYSKT